MSVRKRRPHIAGAILALAFTVLGTNAADATPILVDSDNDGNVTGSRSSGNGITSGGDWTAFDLEFLITFDSNTSLWSYRYEFFVDDPDPSHFIFEVSTFITEDNIDAMILDELFAIEDDDPKMHGPDPGNPGFPVGGDFYGVKAEELDGLPSPRVITFLSPQAPIWGDFYVKGGSDSFAFNTGIGTDPTLGDAPFTNWIPVPDTVNGQSVPEPGTLLLLGAALLGLRRASKRRLS